MAVMSEQLPEFDDILPSVARPGRQPRRLRDRRPPHTVDGFGNAGSCTRIKIGMSKRPFDIAGGIEMIAQIRD